MKSRHVCPHCGAKFITMTADEYEGLLKKKPDVIVKMRNRTRTVTRTVVETGKLTKRARVFLQRGVDVPPQLEEDWATLKRSGMSSQEAAAALGLPYFDPRHRTEPK